MSKLLELISDIQDYGYDITTEKKVSNKTLADYLAFHFCVQDDKTHEVGKAEMKKDVLCYLNGFKKNVFPAHVQIVQEIISQVEQL
jgi:hypothetical protein